VPYVPMPAQESIALNDLKDLFPEAGEAGEQNEPKTVTMARQTSLHLAIEDDRLLKQQRIFHHKIGAATT
jgi:hypothetical protein